MTFFVGVIILSTVLGLLLAFVVYGRIFLKPIF
jgi:hypothetical protein